jgi:hypothetical protein
LTERSPPLPSDEIRIVEVFLEPGGAHERVHRRFDRARLIVRSGAGRKQAGCGNKTKIDSHAIR